VICRHIKAQWQDISRHPSTKISGVANSYALPRPTLTLRPRAGGWDMVFFCSTSMLNNGLGERTTTWVKWCQSPFGSPFSWPMHNEEINMWARCCHNPGRGVLAGFLCYVCKRLEWNFRLQMLICEHEKRAEGMHTQFEQVKGTGGKMGGRNEGMGLGTGIRVTTNLVWYVWTFWNRRDSNFGVQLKGKRKKEREKKSRRRKEADHFPAVIM
jgi:hypothetical protein